MSFLLGMDLTFLGVPLICCSDSLMDRSRDGDDGDSAEVRFSVLGGKAKSSFRTLSKSANYMPL